MSVTVTTYGDIGKAVEDGNSKAIAKIVTKVVNAAKAGAPFDTGQLRNSIMGQVNGASYGHQGGPSLHEQVGEGEGLVGTALAHGVYNEFGTRKMAAQPYLRPAVSEVTSGSRAKDIIIELQAQSVREGMRKGPRAVKVTK